MNDLDKAREWANDISYHPCSYEPEEVEAAKIILNLPNQWVDADKVREVLDMWAENPFPTSDEVAVLNDFEALLTPPLPTLADMTPEERDTQKWMQAKVFPTASTPGIITGVDEYAHSAIILFADGMAKNVPWGHITPLPDAPKLEWPSLSVSVESEAVSVETEDVTEESDPAQEPQPVVKTLRTVEDYEAAAIGTVVRRQELPWLAATFHKSVDGIWNSTGAHEYPSSEMAGTARTVLWEPKP